MKVAIIEDEKSAAENLKYLLNELDDNISIDKMIDTVDGAVEYFLKDKRIDLAFFDIHLADGISFEIFNKVKIKIPIIFTTAYDEYALRAFRVNSIDYLLKPIDEDELKESIEKFKTSRASDHLTQELKHILKNIKKESKRYRSSFLVQQRDLLIPLDVEEIAYFMIESGIVRAKTFDRKLFNVDEKLDDLEASLNPEQFFRANRQFIVHRRAISNLSIYFNGKLLLNIDPNPEDRIIVSKAKAPLLKNWMN